MKKLVSALLVAATMLSFAACGKTNDESKNNDSAATSGKLIMATEAGFAPYEYLDGNKVVGVDVDIANAIAKDMGKEIEIQNITFDGALLAVQQGKVDMAIAGISVDEDRQEAMDFSVTYATSDLIMVVKNDSTIKGSADIKNDTKAGFQTGTTGQSYVEDELKCEPKAYTKYAQAAEDLANGKIDCIIMDKIVAEAMVKEHSNFTILSEVLEKDEFAIAVKKGNKELLDKINPIIEKLIKDGKVDEFTLKHTMNN